MQQVVVGIEGLRGCVPAESRVMLVCDGAYANLNIKEDVEKAVRPVARFDGFTPNPLYESVVNGVDLFHRERCDTLVAIGGGSTIDVAKCIKLFCRMPQGSNFLQQEYRDSGVPLIAIPTTAGTGSESTRFAVVYYEGKKQSVTHDSILPNTAVLESSVLLTLPPYQKKSTMMDALCQGIESWWSVNSTEESRAYSREAVETIVAYWQDYIYHNSATAAAHIMRAAHRAGQAINISQTTAPHAMSYKITSIYGLAHGHAVAVCLPGVWEYMIGQIGACRDARGESHLKEVFADIARALGCSNAEQGVREVRRMIGMLELPNPRSEHRKSDLQTLTQSVNPVRLKNNPVALTEETLMKIYSNIVECANK